MKDASITSAVLRLSKELLKRKRRHVDLLQLSRRKEIPTGEMIKNKGKAFRLHHLLRRLL
jgi:hypothetical protein